MFNKIKDFSNLTITTREDDHSPSSKTIVNIDLLGSPYSMEFEESIFDTFYKDINSNQIVSERNLIPPGLKYVYNNFIVFERPPTHKLINCYDQSLEHVNDFTKLKSYYIPIPWQLYIVEFDPSNFRTCNVSMFFMNTPLFSPDQTLYLPPIPNFYVNGLLCRPFFYSLEDIERYPQDISGVINSAYDWVWSSNFNLDLTETISSIYKQRNPIEISKGLSGSERIGYRIPMSIIDEVYSHWETLSLHEVTSYVWPNPAYHNTFDQDASNIDYQNLAENWIEDHNLEWDEDDYTYDQLVEDVMNSEDFRLSVGDPRKVSKTYSQVIENLTNRSHFVKLSNRSFQKRLFDLVASHNVEEPF
jgi:hypothetical protein